MTQHPGIRELRSNQTQSMQSGLSCQDGSQLFATVFHHLLTIYYSMILSTLTLRLSLAASMLARPVEQVTWSSPLTSDVKVPIMLGVMSRFPDALMCESVFNQVLPKVEGKIDLALTYVDWYGLSI